MRAIITVVVCVCQLFSGHSFGQKYTLESNTPKIDWIGYGELDDFQQKGTIEIQSSNLTMDELGKVTGVVRLDMTSISHNDESLSDHLKNKDFFHVKKYPVAEFQFSQDENGEISGTLNMKGEKSDVSFSPQIKREDNSVIVTGTVQVDRTLHGIKYNSSSYFQDLGSYAIKNFFDVYFELKYKKTE